MTRRSLLLFGQSAAIAVLAVCALLLPPRSSAINRENAEKITNGMTVREIEAILGGAARDDSTGPVEPAVMLWTRGKRMRWLSDSVSVSVYVEDGLVATHVCEEMRRVQESPIGKLRRWLHL